MKLNWEVLIVGVLIGVISMLVSPLWDMATTAIVNDLIFICQETASPAVFHILFQIALVRIDFWLKIWIITFSGMTTMGYVFCVFSIMGSLIFIIAKRELDPWQRVVGFITLQFVFCGFTQIFNAWEEWIGIWYRYLMGYDLLMFNEHYIGSLYWSLRPYLGTYMVPIGDPITPLWIPWWCYILARVGAGLILLVPSYLAYHYAFHQKLLLNWKSVGLIVASVGMMVLPSFLATT